MSEPTDYTPLEATIADLRSQLEAALHELMQWRPTDEAMSHDKLELDSWRKQARAWQAAYELASEQVERRLGEALAALQLADEHYHRLQGEDVHVRFLMPSRICSDWRAVLAEHSDISTKQETGP